MKVLYHHRTMADGAEGIHIREIVSALRALGHQVRVVALAGDPTQPATREASRLPGFRRLIPAAGYELAEIGYNEVGYRRLMAAVREFSPDFIYDRYNTYSTAALRAARRARLPLLLEVNAPMAFERSTYEHLRLKFPALARRYERAIFAGADRIFAVSTPLKRHLVDVVGTEPDKIVVLPNGADPGVFVPGQRREEIRERYQLRDRVVIGFVGILRPWHGVDLLLEALAALRPSHPTVHLLIVGDGPIQSELEQRSRVLNLEDAVTFTGRVPHHDVVAHVAAMDVAVSPETTFYASPMKVLEYMAMQRAVVAPAMDNLRDIVDQGVTGLLFTPRDSQSLYRTLHRLLIDANLREALGRNARSRIVEHLNWISNARSIIENAKAIWRNP